MSPKRSSIAVAVLLSASGIIAAPIAFVCENYPEWALLAVIGPLTLVFVVVISSTVAFRRRRRAQFAEFGAGIGHRGPAICQACGICGVGGIVSSFGGDFFRATGLMLTAIGACVSTWHVFRAWPEGSHPGDGDKVRGISPMA